MAAAGTGGHPLAVTTEGCSACSLRPMLRRALGALAGSWWPSGELGSTCACFPDGETKAWEFEQLAQAHIPTDGQQCGI